MSTKKENNTPEGFDDSADESLDMVLEETGVGSEDSGEVVRGAEEDPAGESDAVIDEFLNEETSDDPEPPAQPAGKKHNRGDSRKFRYGSVAAAITLVAVVLVVLLNVVAGVLYKRFPVTFDLTKDQRYSMSEESEKILKELDKKVEIVIFATEEEFLANYGVVQLQFQEALKQYQSMSGGKVSYKYVDLVSNPTIAAQYPDNKAGEVLFRSTFKDENGKEVSRTQTVAGDSFYTEDTSNYYYTGEVSLTSSEVEPVMAKTLLKVASDDTPLVVILTGYEENEYAVSGITQTLGSANYRTEQHNIASEAEFPKDAVLAVIPAPTKDYSEASIERLSKWLANDNKFNRHLMVVPDTTAKCPNLYKYVQVEFDIQITNNLVTETDYNRVFGSYSYFIYGDIAGDEMVGGAAGKLAAMPQTLQLITTRSNDTNNSKYGVDLVTFPESARLTPITDAESDDEKEPVEASSYPVVGMAYASNSGYIDGTDRYTQQILVCGSPLALETNLLKQLPSAYNEQAIIGVLNSMTGNEIDVYIQSYTFSSTTIEFSEWQALLVGWIFIGLIPLSLIAAGIVVFAVRRRL